METQGGSSAATFRIFLKDSVVNKSTSISLIRGSDLRPPTAVSQKKFSCGGLGDCKKVCLQISAKCSRYISGQTPDNRFMATISLRYELLFAPAHGIFYKQRHQIWPLHKLNSKWLHLRTSFLPNVDTHGKCRYIDQRTM